MVVPVDDIVEVSDSHVVNLLQFYWSNTYETDKHSDTHEDILNFVELLWTLDYSCLVISNEEGKLCPNYPSRMFIPDAHMKTAPSKTKFPFFCADEKDDDLKLCVPKADRTKILQNLYKVLDVEFPGNEVNSQEYTCLAIKTNYQSIECVSPLLPAQLTNYKEYCSSIEERTKTLQNLMEKAIFGRSRHRIVVPVILYNGVYVTRSATIPMAGEFYFRKTTRYLYSFVSFDLNPFYDAMKSNNEEEREDAQKNLSAIDQARAADVELLKHMKINTAFDLMVEEKKVCYGIYTASSEKALRNEEINHYSHLFINQVPYPGCEYFAKFAETLHCEDLVFNWDDPAVNAHFMLESKHLLKFNNPQYKTWSLDYLTKHYLMIMLTHLKQGETKDGGLLVHCISGWDRTPLFISLLRISLWADGEIHQSLCPLQMLYFTLAYDWMFFCHNMKLRTSRMELILFFCFYFLKFIKGENFNLKSRNFGQNIEAREYCDEFELLDFPEAESPDQYLSGASDNYDSLNMSKSPDNLKNENIARTKKREDNKSEVVNAGDDEPTQDKDEAKIPLAEKLLGRGMSSPTEPGANMPKTLLTDSERKRAFRYQRITALRRIFFKTFKKSLPNVEGLGIMEADYEK